MISSQSSAINSIKNKLSFLPAFSVSDHGIQYGHHLSHAGRRRDFLCLPSATKRLKNFSSQGYAEWLIMAIYNVVRMGARTF